MLRDKCRLNVRNLESDTEEDINFVLDTHLIISSQYLRLRLGENYDSLVLCNKLDPQQVQRYVSDGLLLQSVTYPEIKQPVDEEFARQREAGFYKHYKIQGVLTPWT